MPPALLSLYLVVATIAVFVYAFYAVFVELRKEDSSANDTTTADEENAEIAPNELSVAHEHACTFRLSRGISADVTCG